MFPSFLSSVPAQIAKSEAFEEKAFREARVQSSCLPPRWSTSRRRVALEMIWVRRASTRAIRVGARNDFIHQTDAIGFLRVNNLRR